MRDIYEPQKDCFKCKLYDKCGLNDDDRCLLKLKTKKKKSNRMTVLWEGQQLSIRKWAAALGMNYTTLWYKIKAHGIDSVFDEMLEAKNASTSTM